MAGSSNQGLNLQETIWQQALIYYEQLVERMQLIERVMPQAVDLDRLDEQLWRLREESSKLFDEQQEQFAEYQRRLNNKISEKYRKALQRLGEEGWFLDPEMPALQLREIECLFDEHPDEIAEGLSDFFRTRLDDIEGVLVDSYSSSWSLISTSFRGSS